MNAAALRAPAEPSRAESSAFEKQISLEKGQTHDECPCSAPESVKACMHDGRMDGPQ